MRRLSGVKKPIPLFAVRLIIIRQLAVTNGLECRQSMGAAATVALRLDSDIDHGLNRCITSLRPAVSHVAPGSLQSPRPAWPAAPEPGAAVFAMRAGRVTNISVTNAGRLGITRGAFKGVRPGADNLFDSGLPGLVCRTVRVIKTVGLHPSETGSR